MKKLVLFFAVAFTMSFASCGNKKAADNVETTEPATVITEDFGAVEAEPMPADSDSLDNSVVIEETATEIVAQ